MRRAPSEILGKVFVVSLVEDEVPTFISYEGRVGPEGALKLREDKLYHSVKKYLHYHSFVRNFKGPSPGDLVENGAV
jgi:hypothetical protein